MGAPGTPKVAPNRLAWYRVQKKCTMTELRRKTNLSTSVLQKIESGRIPTKEASKIISTALNVPVAELFPEPGEGENERDNDH